MFITKQHFCSKYNCKVANLERVLREEKGKIKTKTDREMFYFEESFFVRRFNFYQKLVNEAHDYYYFIVNEDRTQTQLSELLSKYYDERLNCWNTFLSQQLFAANDKPITNYKIPDMLWRFWRFARWYIIWVKSASCVSKNITINQMVCDVLNRRMES